MDLGQKIRSLRKSHNLSQKELAEKLNITSQALSQYELNKRIPDTKMVLKIADIFDISVDWLLGRDSQKQELKPETKFLTEVNEFEIIPVVGTIAAGKPVFAEQNIINYRKIPKDEVEGGQFFYLEVQGDSMLGAGIKPGYNVLVRRQSDVDDGDIAVVMVNSDEATLKRVYRTNGKLILQPENSKYKPIVIESGDVRIIGKVLKVEFDI